MIDRAIFKLFGIRSMMLIVLVFAVARAVLVIWQSLSLAYVIVSLCEGAEMDRVIFIEDGSVFLDGAPGTLEQQSGRYRRLLAFERGVAAL